MNDVFRNMLNWYTIVYLDKILIYLAMHYEHVKHVIQVLQHLHNHGLYAKAEKWEFHKQELLFLSYRISPRWVEMETSKVGASLQWPELRTVKGL